MARVSLKSGGKSKRLDRYAGEWLALAGERVVAHDRSLSKVIECAAKKCLKGKTSIFLVPRKDEGPYLLLL